MSRRRRAVLLLGLALALGGLAASDVSRRESALQRRLGPPVPVVVARQAVTPGTQLTPDRLAVRSVPARYAPAGAFGALVEVVGSRAAVAVPGGGYLGPGQVDSGSGQEQAGPQLRPGERAAEIVATGAADEIAPGTRVNVLVSREGERGEPGRTVLALEDVEVLAAAPATGTSGSGEGAADLPRVAAALRVTLRQAVYLAAAQSFAREIRLLARAPGDRSRGAAGLTVDGALG